MDDPLRVHGYSCFERGGEGLNPYCNGWSSKSIIGTVEIVDIVRVLILIVMDDPLRDQRL